MSNNDGTISVDEVLSKDVLDKLDDVLRDQMGSTITRVLDEVGFPARLSQRDLNILARATAVGMVAHISLVMADLEGPEGAMGLILETMANALQENYSNLKIELHSVPMSRSDDDVKVH
jgi:hypothetical protein